MNIANATLDDVLIGHDVPVSANHETSAGLFDGFTGLWWSGSRFHKVRADRHLHVNGRLTVECESECKGLARRQLPVLVGETQSPAIVLAYGNDEIDAALISGARCAMRERTVFIIGVGTPVPVANIDGTIRTASVRRCRCQSQAECRGYRVDCGFHLWLPTVNIHHTGL